MSNPDSAKPVIIKKYANRRLYDTGISAYITLEDLYERVKAGKEFTVVDARTGQDLTRQVLTQIIFEQESKGFQILPTSFLRSVIRFYDDKMQDVLQHYLDASMSTFMSNQERFQQMIGKAMMGGLSPFSHLEELTRQNVALFEKTMQMFNPLSRYSKEKDEDPKADPKR